MNDRTSLIATLLITIIHKVTPNITERHSNIYRMHTMCSGLFREMKL